MKPWGFSGGETQWAITGPRIGRGLQSAVFPCTFYGLPGVAKTFFPLHHPHAHGVGPDALRCLVDAYEAELAILWSIRHPHIVPLYGVAYDSLGCPLWTVSEAMGLALSAMLAMAQPPTIGLTLAADMFCALSFLHARTIAHGNIKPSNIFFQHGAFKLTNIHPGNFRTLLMTTTGLPSTCSIFQAPEDDNDVNAKQRGDMWSAGLIIARMGSLTDPPHDALCRIAYATAATRGVLVEAAAVIEACVQIDPFARPSAVKAQSLLPSFTRAHLIGGAAGTDEAVEAVEAAVDVCTNAEPTMTDAAVDARLDVADVGVDAVPVVVDAEVQGDGSVQDSGAQSDAAVLAEASTQTDEDIAARVPEVIPAPAMAAHDAVMSFSAVSVAHPAIAIDQAPHTATSCVTLDDSRSPVDFKNLMSEPEAALSELSLIAGRLHASQRELEDFVVALSAADTATANACLLNEEMLQSLLAATALHPDQSLHECVLKLIATLVFRNAPNQAHLLRCGVLPAIIHSMDKGSNFAGVQEYGCRIISSLALLPEGWTASWRNSCIEVIIRSLKACGEHNGVALHACAALCNMGNTGEIQAFAVRNGAFPQIVAAMGRHGAHNGIQEQACRALRTIVAEYHPHFVEAGGPAAILRAMFMHWGSTSVIEQALRTLREAIRNGLSLKPAVMPPTNTSGSGTPPTVRRATFTSPFFSSKSKPVETAEPLPVVDTDVIPEGNIVVDAQIVCAVVRAMGAHPAVVAIQEAGLAILRFLSYRNHDNQILIARRGGISAMVAAMRAHIGNMALQEEGCRLISNMAENAAIVTEILSARTTQAVLAAQQAFPRNAHIEVCAHLVGRS